VLLPRRPKPLTPARDCHEDPIEGSLNIPLTHLEKRAGEIPAGRPVAVHCEDGYRSAIAASLLQKLGRHDVCDLVGGYKAWLAAKPSA